MRYDASTTPTHHRSRLLEMYSSSPTTSRAAEIFSDASDDWLLSLQRQGILKTGLWDFDGHPLFPLSGKRIPEITVRVEAVDLQ